MNRAPSEQIRMLSLALHSVRRSAQLSLSDAAGEIGISVTALNRIENAQECDYTIGKKVEEWIKIKMDRAAGRVR